MALPDYTPRNVVYHDICNLTSEALPPQVYEYVAAVNTLVLPAQSFEELARYCDEHEREELPQAQARLKAQGRVSDGVEIGVLAHILPDVVSTVRHLTQHRRLGHCVDLTHTILIFVETCLSAVSPDAFVLENVQFALSRPPHSLSDPLARFLPYYAKASFAFVPLEISVGEDDDMEAPSPDAQHSREASPMQTSESAPSSYTSYPSDFEEWLRMPNGRHHSRRAENRSLRSYAFQDDEVSENDQPEPVELAPQTELLARRGSDKLCILVIAPRNRLLQAMSSALYHRQACGVLGPITGLVIHQDSTEAEFAVGWLDDTPASENELLTVNIAWRMTNARSSCGTYELKDLGSTLLLGAVILSLMSKCRSDPERIDAWEDETPLWRMDGVVPSDECESRGDQDDSVLNWALAAELPTASGSSIPASQQASVTTQSQTRSHNEPKTAISSTYSKIAGQPAADREAQPFWTWLRDRRVISIMLPSPWLSAVIDDADLTYQEHYTKITPFVNCYHDYITLPRSCLDQLPPHVQTHMDPSVSHFYESLSAFQYSLAKHAHEPWMVGLSKLLRKHCHVIMRISVLAERAKRIGEKVDDIGIRFRKYFDLLLEIGLDNPEPEDGGVVFATLYEKQLQMPSNKLYHQANQIADLLEDFDYAKKAAAALHYPILHQSTILEQEHQAYRDALHNLNPAVPQIEAGRMERFAASARLWQFKQEQLSSAVVSAATIDLGLLAQPSAQALRTGKCDAVGVLRIPGVFPVLTEEARAFQILRPPSSMTVDPNGDESQPADGVTETQRLDIRDIDLEQPVNPTVSRDIFASARSSRVCNILGQTSTLQLTPVTTTVREMRPIPEHPASPTNPSSESNQQPDAALDISPAVPPDPSTDIRIIARVNQVPDNSRPAGSVLGPVDITNDDVKDDLRDPRVEPLPEKEGFDLHTDFCDLYVPLIVIENKNVLSEDDMTGANQLRGHLAALSTFLGHLGVDNFPQFGILTEGTVGVVTCAWSDILKHPVEPAPPRAAMRFFASKTHLIPNHSTVTYIMERNACSFDISDPRDALNLVAFLYKISRIHAPKLKEALRETCDKIRKGEMSPYPQWNQNQFYPAPRNA